MRIWLVLGLIVIAQSAAFIWYTKIQDVTISTLYQTIGEMENKITHLESTKSDLSKTDVDKLKQELQQLSDKTVKTILILQTDYLANIKSLSEDTDKKLQSIITQLENQ